MSENNAPLIALIHASGYAKSDILRTALLGTVKAGVPTEPFRCSTFGDAESFLDALPKSEKKFDGIVIFYDTVSLDLGSGDESDSQLKELLYKSILYGIRKIIVTNNDMPDTDEYYDNFEYISDFMADLGFGDDSFTFLSCPISDFVNADRPAQFISAMRPLIEEINRIIIEPSAKPAQPAGEIEDFDGLVFSRYGGERLVTDTRVTVKIGGEEYIAFLKVKSRDPLPNAIYSKVHIDLITPIPNKKGTRFMVLSRLNGNIMGVGSLL